MYLDYYNRRTELITDKKWDDRNATGQTPIEDQTGLKLKNKLLERCKRSRKRGNCRKY